MYVFPTFNTKIKFDLIVKIGGSARIALCKRLFFGPIPFVFLLVHWASSTFLDLEILKKSAPIERLSNYFRIFAPLVGIDECFTRVSCHARFHAIYNFEFYHFVFQLNAIISVKTCLQIMHMTAARTEEIVYIEEQSVGLLVMLYQLFFQKRRQTKTNKS